MNINNDINLKLKTKSIGNNGSPTSSAQYLLNKKTSDSFAKSNQSPIPTNSTQKLNNNIKDFINKNKNSLQMKVESAKKLTYQFYLQNLLETRNSSGQKIFDNADTFVLEQQKPEVHRKALKLTKIKNSYGETMFKGQQITSLALLNDEMYKKVLLLSKLINSNGENIFEGEQIYYFISNGENYCNKAIELSKTVDIDDKNVFNGKNIISLVFAEEGNYTKALNLLNVKDPNGKNVFSGDNIEALLGSNDTVYGKVFNLLNIKDKKGNNRFSTDCICSLATGKDSLYKKAIEMAENNSFTGTVDFFENIKLQNGNGRVFQYRTTNVNEATGAKTTTTRIQDAKGKIITQTTINHPDNKIYSCINGDSNKVSRLKLKEVEIEGIKLNELQEKFDFVKNKSGKVEYIDYTSVSTKYDGLFETTRYYLKDYKGSTLDIISDIQKRKIKGVPISKITRHKDGGISYSEKFENPFSQFITQRNYTETSTEKFYTYTITNKETGEVTTLAQKSFVKNPDGSTTAKIDNKTYQVHYDNKNKSVSITDEIGFKYEINLLEKFDSQNTPKQNELLWKAVKELQVDNLIALDKKVKKWTYTKLFSECGFSAPLETLMTNHTLGTIEHELGHSLVDTLPPSAQVNEFKKIYNKEWNNLRNNIPEAIQELIEYFSPIGGGKYNTGLVEFQAEANMLLSRVVDDTPGLKTRGQLLVQYFPETMSCISKILKCI